MIHELWYTSAPRGLYPGSSGFCTVKATKDIPLPLRELLESLSHYRHIYAPSDHLAAKNPINYSNLTTAVAGTRWNIISRIQDAGLDHTQRSNFFAHHIAIDVATARYATPTKLLTHPQLFAPAWDFRVEELLASRELNREREPLRVCRSWQAVAGDAGWAGVVAESIATHREVYLAFTPGAHLLPLIAEVMAVTPEAKQSELTFSTYYHSASMVADCKLRCVVVNSEEHREAARSRALIIDLTVPQPPPAGGELVEVARSGQRVEAPVPKSSMNRSSRTVVVNEAVSLETAVASASNLQPDWRSPKPTRLQSPQQQPINPVASEPAQEPAYWLLPVIAFAGVALACLILVPFLLTTRAELSRAHVAVQELTSENGVLARNLTKATSEGATAKQENENLKKARADVTRANEKLDIGLQTAQSNEELQRNTRLSILTETTKRLHNISITLLNVGPAETNSDTEEDPTVRLNRTVEQLERAVNDRNNEHTKQMADKDKMIAGYKSTIAQQMEELRLVKAELQKAMPKAATTPSLPAVSRLPNQNDTTPLVLKRLNDRPKFVELVENSDRLALKKNGNDYTVEWMDIPAATIRIRKGEAWEVSFQWSGNRKLEALREELLSLLSSAQLKVVMENNEEVLIPFYETK